MKSIIERVNRHGKRQYVFSADPGRRIRMTNKRNKACEFNHASAQCVRDALSTPDNTVTVLRVA